MKIIGLTGGIGSGKSTIAKMFEALKIPVYYADVEAKRLMNKSANIKNKLISLFGDKAYIENKINRSFIANIVFKDQSMLQKLNAIVHPEVAKQFKNWLIEQNAAYVIQENAIIFENNNQNNFDDIITVTAPEFEKIRRVMKRDNVSEKLVKERMDNQFNDDYKIERSRYIINNMDLLDSRNQVTSIHKQLLKK